MSNKKIISLLFSLSFFISLIGCSPENKDNNTAQKEINAIESGKEDTTNTSDKEPISTPVSFEALGQSYTVNKDINTFSKNAVIFNPINTPYISGEYMEIDFAKDLLTGFLNEDESVYNSLVSYDSSSKNGIIPITNEDKSELKENLSNVRKERLFSQGEKVVVIMDKVVYEGASSETNTGISLNIRIGISHVGDKTAPWINYYVTVFRDNNKLVANLQ